MRLQFLRCSLHLVLFHQPVFSHFSTLSDSISWLFLVLLDQLVEVTFDAVELDLLGPG